MLPVEENERKIINNTCNTEENGTATNIRGNPCLHQVNPHDIIIGKPLGIGAKNLASSVKVADKIPILSENPA